MDIVLCTKYCTATRTPSVLHQSLTSGTQSHAGTPRTHTAHCPGSNWGHTASSRGTVRRRRRLAGAVGLRWTRDWKQKGAQLKCGTNYANAATYWSSERRQSTEQWRRRTRTTDDEQTTIATASEHGRKGEGVG